MPSARKNTNNPVVKNTTWIAWATTITATTLTCSASESGVRAGAVSVARGSAVEQRSGVASARAVLA